MLKRSLENMENSEPHTSGQVFTELNEEALAAALAADLPQIRIGESCHYSTGNYVRVDFESESEFYFERISGGEYLIRGEGESVSGLASSAEKIASALTRRHMKCRLETYDSEDSLNSYSHNTWPQ